MKTIYYNIETMVAQGIFPDPSKVKAPKTWKDPVKIAERKEKDALEIWEKNKVHPTNSQVCAITVLPAEDEFPIVMMNVYEELLFQQFAEWLAAWKLANPGPIRWNTFNGIDLDYPFTFMRAVKYKLYDLAREMVPTRYPTALHEDMRYRLARTGTLDDYAAFFGIENPNDISGDKLTEAIRRGDHARAMAHMTTRVTLLREIDKLIGAIDE